MMPEVSAVERHILDQMERILEKIETINSSMSGMASDVKGVKEDIEDSKGHADRLTRLEQRMDDAEHSRRAINENIRWLLGLVIVALVGIAGILFKR